ncbi:MAG: NYN domain-containing protein [Polyangiales bacterium]
MKNYTYVDNSNVFIEGQRVSAVAKGQARNIYEAMNSGLLDHGWNIDYGKLHKIVCGPAEEIGGANLWGSPPPSDSFWKMVESHGFKVTTYEKSLSGKEKKVDVAIAHRMTKDAYTLIDRGTSGITLVSGDKDFVPVVADLRSEGFTVIVAFWSHAAEELKASATAFFDLNPHHQAVSR